MRFEKSILSAVIMDTSPCTRYGRRHLSLDGPRTTTNFVNERFAGLKNLGGVE
jgi:hypothetical protein